MVLWKCWHISWDADWCEWWGPTVEAFGSLYTPVIFICLVPGLRAYKSLLQNLCIATSALDSEYITFETKDELSDTLPSQIAVIANITFICIGTSSSTMLQNGARVDYCSRHDAWRLHSLWGQRETEQEYLKWKHCRDASLWDKVRQLSNRARACTGA